uniref:Dual specificity phosphatase 26 n=1 Tax=Danio rerio TaxID=7955 RepID=A0A8M2BK12_DANRE|nr:dual specificity protein phosphatase 26 isoform X1 [Danio rerio]XP_005172806.1 dual specificity protein phosphatase 26 isoform X1 [Danio rerio]|eukprot:XP_005172805.1 dual specificity protein phosphatase 26 isoform X1 [Danio rerio]
MESWCNAAKSPAHLFESNEEEKYSTLRRSEGTVEEEEFESDEEINYKIIEIDDNVEFGPDYHSSDEDEPELHMPAETDAAYMSKTGHVLWSPTPPPSGHKRFPSHLFENMTPGPTSFACSNAQDIKSTFELFFPDEIKEMLMQISNLEGKRVYGAAWKDLDWTDLQAFIGILILIGVYRSKHESVDSLWDGVLGRPIFRATMALYTFKSWSRVICFRKRDPEPGQKSGDKLAPILNVWDKWVERLPLMYNPGQNLTVDKCLVPFRGRCPFKIYMQCKPAKYGIQIWAVCDSKSSYAWNMQIHTGKPADGKAEEDQAMRVVLDMTSALEGHNITCDQSFTSYALGEELLRRNITMIGTTRLSNPELPPALLSVKGRAINSSKFAFTDTHTLVSYHPRKNKNVLVMSTLHRDDAENSDEQSKPQMILDYNSTRGGVDNFDKLTSTYTCQRKTLHWPMVIFFNMLDVSAYNAFVLWMDLNPSWEAQKTNRRRIFLQDLGRALVTPHLQRRERLPRLPNSINMIVEAQSAPEDIQRCIPPVTDPKRKRCEPCNRSTNGGKRRDTKTRLTCDKCNMYICKAHAVITTLCYRCTKEEAHC